MTLYAEPSPALAALIEKLAGQSSSSRSSRFLQGLDVDIGARGGPRIVTSDLERVVPVNTPSRSAARGGAAAAAGRPVTVALAMDRGPHRGARDRDAAGPVLAGPARRRRNGPVGRPHAARRGLRHDRRPRRSRPPDRHWRPRRPSSDRPGFGWLYSPGLLGKVRIRVTPASSGPPLFVGIGPSSDVERYLAGVEPHGHHRFFGAEKTENVDGGPPRSAPGTQNFWVASDHWPRTTEPVLEPDRRIVDGRGNERRRAHRDRRGRGPGSAHAGPAVGRHRACSLAGASSWPAGRC